MLFHPIAIILLLLSFMVQEFIPGLEIAQFATLFLPAVFFFSASVAAPFGVMLTGLVVAYVAYIANPGLPAAFTATGKAFLSHMSDFEVRRLYNDGLPPPRTHKSVRTVDDLIDEIRKIRSLGFSCDDEQVADEDQ